MSLTAGSRLGAYEILSLLGAGGMGEVYKARDTRLDRTVAIKVMPSDFAADPQFRARFDREARAISQLQHPHICTLHDIGEVDGTAFLVMELLQGQTLAERLKKGALPLDEALKVAIDVADALSAAQKQGIVHRDLKPGNVMLTKTGAKLLDFGLAKPAVPVVGISAAGRGDTAATTHVTGLGAIVGTPHYMSPEQVEGGDADARADIWALGVVLYEMLTGKRPFDGSTAASIVSSILKDTPLPVSSRRALAPPMLDNIVGRCLMREADARWQSAADLCATLKLVSSTVATESHMSGRRRPAWLRMAYRGAAAVFAFGVGVILGSRLFPEEGAPRVVQFDVLPPIDATLSPAPVAQAPQLALSPDGRQLAFVAAKRRGLSQIYVRSIDGRDVRVLPGTEGASFLFWSPDSRNLAFFAGRSLKKIGVGGGAPQVLCDAPAGRGGTWGPDGTILFSPTPNKGLSRISSQGGQPTDETTVEPSRKVIIGQNWPQFLPDGRHYLFYQRAFDPELQGIYIGELGSAQRSARVLATSGLALYASGFLTFVKDGALLAQAFDQRTLKTTGEPIRVADHVAYFSGSFGFSSISVSSSGLLAYGGAVGTTSTLQWVGRDGRFGDRLGVPGVYSSPRLSRDQKAVVVAVAGETMAERDLWMLDVTRNVASRLTTDPSADWFPTLSPTSNRIYFGSSRSGITTMFEKVGGATEVRLTTQFPFAAYPNDVSQDGRLLAYQLSTESAYDIGVMTLDKKEMAPFLDTPFNEVQPRFAPGARWLAYSADESGQFEVYVRPYPKSDMTQPLKISQAGGMQPEWRADGRELFYVSPDGKMMAVPIVADKELQPGTPHALFDVDMPEATAPYPAHYAVSDNGQRFLINTVTDQPNRPGLTVILNWTVGLTR